MKTKRFLALFLALMMIFALAACSGESEPTASPTETPTSNPTETPSSNPTEAPPIDVVEYAVTLYADYSYGNTDAEEMGLITPYDAVVVELDPFELADALSALTGLSFELDGWTNGGSYVSVDWSAESSLFVGPPDPQNEDFFFFDIDTLRWFMLDSLRRTLIENLDLEEVYYTMNDGEDLVFDQLSAVATYPDPAVLPADEPFMGSAFYHNHAGGRADDDIAADYAHLEGTWHLDGSLDTSFIVFDSEGYFTTYYASGSVEANGYAEAVEEIVDGDQQTLRYDMYIFGESEPALSFYMDSDTQFHTGNYDGEIFVHESAIGRGDVVSDGAPPMLMLTGGYTGTTLVSSDDAWNGGYLYIYQTEDELTSIYNCCFEHTQGDENFEDFLVSTVSFLYGEVDVNDLGYLYNQDHSLRLGYDVYLLDWTTDEGQAFYSLFFDTHEYTYAYTFNTTPDNRDEMLESWRELLYNLNLD